MKIQAFSFKSLGLFLLFLILTSTGKAQSSYSSGIEHPHTVGVTFYGNFQLLDTVPELDPGLGGGLWWDYRFNDRFSFQLDMFMITQKGDGNSSNEDHIEFLGLPAASLKLYLLDNKYKLDPYVGAGLGFYWLTEGSIENNTGGVGLGAQIELGADYALTNRLIFSLGGTYRSIGMINDSSNGSTYMTLSAFGRMGYRF